jgi:hypothetical protein
MTKFITYSIVGVLSLLFMLIYGTEKIAPLATTSYAPPSTVQQPAKLISFKGSLDKNKIILQWVVKENETADQFIVEKSIAGEKFVVAALVFGSDKPETESYEFYEKANNKRVSYRIKLINKNQETEYSSVIEINPNSKTTEK